MARTIVFTDTYPYAPLTALSPTRRPVVPVRVYNVRDSSRSLDLTMLLDSGADATCLPSELARRLGIDLASLAVRTMRGVSGSAATYRHEGVPMTLASTVIRCPVHFVPGLSVFLLGREGVFDELVFGFEQSAGNIHVRVSPRRRRTR
jgi:hypothetical protein